MINDNTYTVIVSLTNFSTLLVIQYLQYLYQEHTCEEREEECENSVLVLLGLRITGRPCLLGSNDPEDPVES